jgi:hypothetical protein
MSFEKGDPNPLCPFGWGQVMHHEHYEVIRYERYEVIQNSTRHSSVHLVSFHPSRKFPKREMVGRTIMYISKEEGSVT